MPHDQSLPTPAAPVRGGHAVKITADGGANPERGYTSRGFDIYASFTDVYGSEVNVQLSSSAEAARCWIFASNPDMDSPAPHLSVDQAVTVRDALDTFIRENTHG